MIRFSIASITLLDKPFHCGFIEKKSDITAGALQLRSILSGQESVFEPIRIHDISDLMDTEMDRNKNCKQACSRGLADKIYNNKRTYGRNE